MPKNFQSRLIKPKPNPIMGTNPDFESTQMNNPGKPVSITWKFAPPAGAGPTPAPMPSRVAPRTPATMPTARTPTSLPTEPYQRRTSAPFESQVGPPTEPYQRPTPKPVPEPPLDFQDPLDTAALTESALAPLWDKYGRARELAQSALSARGMGRSGALLGHEDLGEEALFRSFVREAGAITSHFALEAAKLGLSQQQIAIAERELALKEKSTGELLDWEKDKFAKLMAEDSRQFNREFSLKESMAMDAAKQEWAKIGLSQQEIDQRADQFNQTLLWQQEQFGMTFGWEQTKWLDQMAFSYAQLEQEGAISYMQMQNDMDQFYADLNQNKWIAKENIRLQDKQLDLDKQYKDGLLSLQDYQNQTDRLRADTDALLADARIAIDQWMAELADKKILGYWDDGYGPGEENAFTGDKLEWSESLEQWVPTPEYAKHMAEHYHRGELDIAEMEAIIYGILGLTGVSNEDETTPTPGDLPDIGPLENMPDWFFGKDRDQYQAFKDEFGDRVTLDDMEKFGAWLQETDTWKHILSYDKWKAYFIAWYRSVGEE